MTPTKGLRRRLAMTPFLCCLCHRELGSFARGDGRLVGVGCIRVALRVPGVAL
jgi:hypothetical protein